MIDHTPERLSNITVFCNVSTKDRPQIFPSVAFVNQISLSNQPPNQGVLLRMYFHSVQMEFRRNILPEENLISGGRSGSGVSFGCPIVCLQRMHVRVSACTLHQIFLTDGSNCSDSGARQYNSNGERRLGCEIYDLNIAKYADTTVAKASSTSGRAPLARASTYF
ncbi:hypothetical protein MAR_003827, partial [Mya arenaria]